MSNRKIGVGSILGPYVITRQIGGGGAGNVFVADDRECQAQVAIKVLRPGADEIEEIHARFIREIAVAQKLDDPHIVAYRDCGVGSCNGGSVCCHDAVIYLELVVRWVEFVPALRCQDAAFRVALDRERFRDFFRRHPTRRLVRRSGRLP